ncbi:MAG: helicase C-terminal domain-containing protein [Candidatus Sumerlaeia bacterium]|nr:helicase C-terminal domain-containing protein [Candidatus Sumerlaeia bacterium]
MTLPVEGPSTAYCTANVIEVIRREIEEAGGTEVFFVGRRDTAGLITEIEALAYGNQSAVAAITGRVRSGEVILHNHPSGYIMPSDPDLVISQQMSELGVGSYICDNPCSRIRIVVRPHDLRRKVMLNPEVIDSYFSRASPLGSQMEFEERPQQRHMAELVARAFNEEGISVVEAGTGTGKSLAYLIPSILYSLENKEKVMISTNTINLQEQILQKDLPVLIKVLGQPIKAEIVKGRSNYVCKRKAEFARDELRYGGQQSFLENDIRQELAMLLDWAKSSPTGDRQELSVQPREEAWEKIGSEADNCLRLRCNFYEECFFYNSRRRAATADLMIVNHSLLLSDLSVRRESNNWSTAAVLPPAKHVILDEAHHLEESATRHLAAVISKYSFRRHFRRLIRSDSSSKQGILPSLTDRLGSIANPENTAGLNQIYTLLVDRVIPETDEVQQHLEHHLDELAFAFLTLAGIDLPRPNQEEKFRLRPPMVETELWRQRIQPRILEINKALQEIGTLHRMALKLFKEFIGEENPELLNLFMDWRAVAERLDDSRLTLMKVVDNDPETCRWVEFKLDKKQNLFLTLNAAPIDVAAVLREVLHTKFKTEVLTSATLTVEKNFQFLFNRIGLTPPSPKKQNTPTNSQSSEPTEAEIQSARPIFQSIFESPFQYPKQVFFGVPNDLGDVRKDGANFERRLAQLILQSVTITEGRAFILFTSYKQLMNVYQLTASTIQSMGYDVYRQGEESRSVLLRKFRENETSVLFATSSFWEGVDVKGRSLELLILAKLPFTVPNDPVAEAQNEFIEAQGGDAFSSLVVPRAIVRFKQGFGRLIRSQTDRGAVLVADDRLQSMAYGRRFLQSLPKMPVHFDTTTSLMAKMTTFFEQTTPAACAPVDLPTE